MNDRFDALRKSLRAVWPGPLHHSVAASESTMTKQRAAPATAALEQSLNNLDAALGERADRAAVTKHAHSPVGDIIDGLMKR
jgi:hypothetical protein